MRHPFAILAIAAVLFPAFAGKEVQGQHVSDVPVQVHGPPSVDGPKYLDFAQFSNVFESPRSTLKCNT